MRRDRARIRTASPRGPRRARGVGLLEVLLAVVLVSIGFLAAARMQVQSLAHGQNAQALSQAKFLLLDVAERMRANRAGLRAGLYDDASTETAEDAVPACRGAALGCTPAEIALADLADWRARLAGDGATRRALLPSTPEIPARATIGPDDGGTRTVSVRWAERTADGLVERVVSVQVNE